MEYSIFCDESTGKGRYYSDFYGGVLVRSVDQAECIRRIVQQKAALGFGGEVKWQKVTQNYLEKYKSLMDTFFSLVATDKLKVRIMFTHNVDQPTALTEEHREHQYFILYYQFIKHAFGLRYSNDDGKNISLRLFPDQLPDTKEQVASFKQFVLRLNRWEGFRAAKITIRPDGISEVDSKNHPLLQCLDVVLGSMNFRLNNLHLEKLPGKSVRGKRTRAKETLYKFINAQIRTIYPNFNIGESTGTNGDMANLWRYPYRHWKFAARQSRKDFNKAKPK